MVERTLFIGTKTIGSKAEARGLPLAEKLFEIGGVKGVQLIGHLLVVTKSKDAAWGEIVEQVEAVLDAYFVSGLALTREQVEERMMLAVEVQASSGSLPSGPLPALNEASIEKAGPGHTIHANAASASSPRPCAALR